MRSLFPLSFGNISGTLREQDLFLTILNIIGCIQVWARQVKTRAHQLVSNEMFGH